MSDYLDVLVEAQAWDLKAEDDFKFFGDAPVFFYSLLRAAEQWGLLLDDLNAKHQ